MSSFPLKRRNMALDINIVCDVSFRADKFNLWPIIFFDNAIDVSVHKKNS